MTYPRISFYIHPRFWPQAEIPASADVAWSGFNLGIYTWTIQTALRLKRAGLACELTAKLPADGIVLAHRDCMSVDGERITAGPERLLINLAADIGLYSPANLQVVQNQTQARFFQNCHCILLWPEPGLVPRDPARGDRFENIAYIGNEKSIAPEMRNGDFANRMSTLGFAWIPKTGQFHYNDPSTYRIGGAWSDYRAIDAVCAVRRFIPRTAGSAFDHKPPSKLINAWIAGVPAILGHESAFRALRRDPLDYVEVCSVEETLAALTGLRESTERRRAMRDNGWARVPEVNAAAIERRWLQFIEEVAVPAYYRWVRVPGSLQRITPVKNALAYEASRIRKRLFSASATIRARMIG